MQSGVERESETQREGAHYQAYDHGVHFAPAACCTGVPLSQETTPPRALQYGPKVLPGERAISYERGTSVDIPSLGLKDYSHADMLGVRYTPINLFAPKKNVPAKSVKRNNNKGAAHRDKSRVWNVSKQKWNLG